MFPKGGHLKFPERLLQQIGVGRRWRDGYGEMVMARWLYQEPPSRGSKIALPPLPPEAQTHCEWFRQIWGRLSKANCTRPFCRRMLDDGGETMTMPNLHVLLCRAMICPLSNMFCMCCFDIDCTIRETARPYKTLNVLSMNQLPQKPRDNSMAIVCRARKKARVISRSIHRSVRLIRTISNKVRIWCNFVRRLAISPRYQGPNQ